LGEGRSGGGGGGKEDRELSGGGKEVKESASSWEEIGLVWNVIICPVVVNNSFLGISGVFGAE